ncbi:FUSC family protein [Allofrancisella guangzhouensis]|uniref:Membrane protein n=1 Tax=Allofrancisella guangzhouensis TaxID=594679 RepID=A0A0A8E9Q6_9GAMM|nr:FUSC family protein [Allofrancisella guangzhouensis]AJC48901.1 membrane protein [Allofrancisella guangzhouensis]MBK2027442.1 FUSC family protein [Allofrancisella guangzhouensis]MBK2044095.1 FUSC family protein [Allofrancisella guangzhouensis]MBK2045853.1 FUSC family protein [Allofrancisella guangzhouensis]
MILFKNRFIDKLSDTTLLAYRVLVASSLGLIISYSVFSFTGEHGFKDRIYWVVIAVISVAASTSTSVIYTRAKAIIVFSIFGTSLGSVLLLFIQKIMVDNSMASFITIAVVCGIALTLYIYTMFLNYATSVFFIHIYLVMFFGLFVGWDHELFIVRIVSVAIGTVCIVFVTFLTRGKKFLNIFTKEMYITYGEFKKILNNVDRNVPNRKLIFLVEKNIKLSEMLVNAKYEFSSNKKYYEYKKMILLMDELLINLKTYRALFIEQKKHNNELYTDLVEYTNSQLKKNFEKLTIRYDRILIQKD